MQADPILVSFVSLGLSLVALLVTLVVNRFKAYRWLLGQIVDDPVEFRIQTQSGFDTKSFAVQHTDSTPAMTVDRTIDGEKSRFSIRLTNYSGRTALIDFAISAPNMFDLRALEDELDLKTSIGMGEGGYRHYVEATSDWAISTFTTPCSFSVGHSSYAEGKELTVELSRKVSIPLSEFRIPILGITLPERAGEVEFPTVTRQVTIKM